MRQYRTEPRTPCNVPADLSWNIGAGYIRNIKVTIRDTSKSGIGLLVPNPVPVGTSIKVTSLKGSQSAVVQRCIKQGAQHIVGGRLQL